MDTSPGLVKGVATCGSAEATKRNYKNVALVHSLQSRLVDEFHPEATKRNYKAVSYTHLTLPTN